MIKKLEFEGFKEIILDKEQLEIFHHNTRNKKIRLDKLNTSKGDGNERSLLDQIINRITHKEMLINL